MASIRFMRPPQDRLFVFHEHTTHDLPIYAASTDQ
jgi:hypothetical protein